MEDNLNGRQPQCKTTSIEDDLNGRRLEWKTNSMVDNLNGRHPQWKTTSRKPYRKQMTSARLASKSCSELGPAQPQLVLYFFCQFGEYFNIKVKTFLTWCLDLLKLDHQSKFQDRFPK